jgi:hypothetical protein
MSLDMSRKNLNMAQDEPVTFQDDRSWLQVRRLADEWLRELKEWESNDDFETAFTDDRITIRAMTDDRKGVGEFPVPAKGEERNPDDRKIKLAYGATGIKARMSPQNFSRTGRATSLKNELGLHDLSASLLTHHRPWHEQLKHYEKATYVMMPMPLQEDMKVFYRLSDLSKGPNVVPTFRQYVREIGSKMTRLKFAAAEDMHTTYVDISNRELKPKPVGKLAQIAMFEQMAGPQFKHPGRFRYGLTGTMGDDSEGAKQVPLSADELNLRRERAKNYKSILNLDKSVVNEVVVAYRSHGTNGRSRFPMYGRLGPQRTTLEIVDSINRKTGNMINAEGKLVPV